MTARERAERVLDVIRLRLIGDGLQDIVWDTADVELVETAIQAAEAAEREACAKDRARLAAAMCILEDCWQGLARAEIAAKVDDLVAIRAREER